MDALTRAVKPYIADHIISAVGYDADLWLVKDQLADDLPELDQIIGDSIDADDCLYDLLYAAIARVDIDALAASIHEDMQAETRKLQLQCAADAVKSHPAYGIER